MDKVAVYGRYGEHRGRGLAVLIRQIENQKRFAKQNDYEVVSVFKDWGHNGSNLKRKGLTELRKQATAHAFEAVLVQDVPILSRSAKDLKTLVDEFQGLGIALIFTENPHTQLIFENH